MRDADLGARNTTWFYALALGVLILDQITKAVARGVLEFDKTVTVIPGFFDLKLGGLFEEFWNKPGAKKDE